MGKIVPVGWCVVVRDTIVQDGFYRSRWGAERRCAAERKAGVDAKVAQACFSTGWSE